MQGIACIARQLVVQGRRIVVKGRLRFGHLRLGDSHFPNPHLHRALRTLCDLLGVYGCQEREQKKYGQLSTGVWIPFVLAGHDGHVRRSGHRGLHERQLHHVQSLTRKQINTVDSRRQSLLIILLLLREPVLLCQRRSSLYEPRRVRKVQKVYRSRRPLRQDPTIIDESLTCII